MNYVLRWICMFHLWILRTAGLLTTHNIIILQSFVFVHWIILLRPLTCLIWVQYNDNRKWYKYVCITTNQPDNNSIISTKQQAIVTIQLNIVTCPTYPEKFIRDNVVAPFLLLSLSTYLSRLIHLQIDYTYDMMSIIRQTMILFFVGFCYAYVSTSALLLGLLTPQILYRKKLHTVYPMLYKPTLNNSKK